MLKGPLVLTVLSIRLATRVALLGRVALHLARGVSTTILQPRRFWRIFWRGFRTKLKIPKLFVVVLVITVFPHLNCTVASAHSIYNNIVLVNNIYIILITIIFNNNWIWKCFMHQIGYKIFDKMTCVLYIFWWKWTLYSHR